MIYSSWFIFYFSNQNSHLTVAMIFILFTAVFKIMWIKHCLARNRALFHIRQISKPIGECSNVSRKLWFSCCDFHNPTESAMLWGNQAAQRGNVGTSGDSLDLRVTPAQERSVAVKEPNDDPKPRAWVTLSFLVCKAEFSDITEHKTTVMSCLNSWTTKFVRIIKCCFKWCSFQGVYSQ